MNLTKEMAKLRQQSLLEAQENAIREQQARDFASEAQWRVVKQGLGILTIGDNK